MVGQIVIEDVVLRGGDLNIVWSRWKVINRANNLRLLPIAIGFLASSFVLSFLVDPTGLELLGIVGPILLGFWTFLWITNAVLLGAYKKIYASTPIGADPCTFVFDADGMNQSMPRGETAFRWSAFVDVVDDKRGFRFWLTPFTAVFLPARFVDEQKAVELRRLIADARERGDIKGP